MKNREKVNVLNECITDDGINNILQTGGQVSWWP